MTILAIYSALSTLAAVYCGWCAVKRWREKRNAVNFIRVALIQHAQALAELDVAVEWLNAANDRVRELDEAFDELKQASHEWYREREVMRKVAGIAVNYAGKVSRAWIASPDELEDMLQESRR